MWPTCSVRRWEWTTVASTPAIATRTSSSPSTSGSWVSTTGNNTESFSFYLFFPFKHSLDFILNVYLYLVFTHLSDTFFLSCFSPYHHPLPVFSPQMMISKWFPCDFWCCVSSEKGFISIDQLNESSTISAQERPGFCLRALVSSHPLLRCHWLGPGGVQTQCPEPTRLWKNR